LLATLKEKADLATLEGRSRLIAEAKPLVRRVAAPGLRMQLVKTLAEVAGMAASEAARLMELRDSVVARPERTPAREERIAAVRSNEAKLLRAILAKPELVDELAIELLMGDMPEVQALRTVVPSVSEQRATGQLAHPLSSAFEQTPYYRLLVELEAELMLLDFDGDAVRAEFEGAIRNLKRQANLREINDMLARNERSGLSERLRENAVLRQQPAAGTDLAG
jgi:DNA primase